MGKYVIHTLGIDTYVIVDVVDTEDGDDALRRFAEYEAKQMGAVLIIITPYADETDSNLIIDEVAYKLATDEKITRQYIVVCSMVLDFKNGKPIWKD